MTGKTIFGTTVLERRAYIVVHDYSKLRGRICEKYRNLSSFAKALGVAPATVSEKVNGNRPITNKDIDKWREPLGIELEDVGKYFFA